MAAEFFEGCGVVGWSLDKCCVRFVGIFSEVEKVENEKSSCRKLFYQYRICIKICMHAMYSLNAVVEVIFYIFPIILYFS